MQLGCIQGHARLKGWAASACRWMALLWNGLPIAVDFVLDLPPPRDALWLVQDASFGISTSAGATIISAASTRRVATAIRALAKLWFRHNRLGHAWGLSPGNPGASRDPDLHRDHLHAENDDQPAPVDDERPVSLLSVPPAAVRRHDAGPPGC
jgi:hypothetical protein